MGKGTFSLVSVHMLILCFRKMLLDFGTEIFLLSTFFIAAKTTYAQFAFIQPPPPFIGLHVAPFPHNNMINRNFVHGGPQPFYPHFIRLPYWNNNYIQPQWSGGQLHGFAPVVNRRYVDRVNSPRRPLVGRVPQQAKKTQITMHKPNHVDKKAKDSSKPLKNALVPKAKQILPKKPSVFRLPLRHVMPHPKIPGPFVHRTRKKALFRGIAKAKSFNRLIGAR